jgi:hypothetical protein
MPDLYIQHGRRTPDLEDWGDDAPTLRNCVGIHFTYGMPRAYFASERDTNAAHASTGWERWDNCCLLMRFHEDMLIAHFADGSVGYFADWGLRVGNGDATRPPTDDERPGFW